MYLHVYITKSFWEKSKNIRVQNFHIQLSVLYIIHLIEKKKNQKVEIDERKLWQSLCIQEKV